MPRTGGATTSKKTTAAQAAVEEANNDLDGLNLDNIDFDGIPDPDAVPDVGEPGDDVPWDNEDSPEVPGDEDIGLEDLGVPGTEAMSVLAEYLPPLRQSVEELGGKVSDYHAFMKKRDESTIATLKALTSDLGSRLGVVEDRQQELLVLVRQLVQGTAPKAAEEKPATPPAKEEKPAKTPPAAKVPSYEEITTKLKLPKPLAGVLSVLKNMPPERSMTTAAFVGWLTTKCSYSADQANKVVELLKVKDPITSKTFQ